MTQPTNPKQLRDGTIMGFCDLCDYPVEQVEWEQQFPDGSVLQSGDWVHMTHPCSITGYWRLLDEPTHELLVQDELAELDEMDRILHDT